MSDRRAFEVMTVREVAEAAGVGERYIRQLCADGRLVASKIAGAWLILEHSAYAWLQSERKVGRPPKGQERPRGEQLNLGLVNGTGDG